MRLATPMRRLRLQWALIVQLSIGIAVVLFGVPLYVAVAHNGGAAVLLLTVINAHKRIWQN